MAQFIYINEDNEFNREASTIKFNIPDDLTIGEFKIMCIRMASAMGYSPKNIEDSFGDGSEVLSSDERRDVLLKSLGIKYENELTGSVDE